MPLEDLSLRLENLNASASESCRTHAAAVVRELVNPLEALNNLAYLLRLSPMGTDGAAFIELLQGQIGLLNTIVLSTIQADNSEPLLGSANNLQG